MELAGSACSRKQQGTRGAIRERVDSKSPLTATKCLRRADCKVCFCTLIGAPREHVEDWRRHYKLERSQS